jgi:alkanesulfonate monooxygenase SsuD/methylene tetrahydromethanopterin reductase-like flavin-dependent oxidoreductase (luciferase family)
MLKPIVQIYPVVRATVDERRAMRPIGRHPERFQEALEESLEVVKAADEMGYWGVSSIEHHFHSEGYEVGPSPSVMNAYWAAITKQIRIGQLGFVMSTNNAIRVAEEIAMIDHLSKGRAFAGFARGYQARWTNILGQHLGTRATLSPSGLDDEKREQFAGGDQAQWAELQQDDEVNRAIFEEQVLLAMRALREESIETDGRLWKVPFPYEQGVRWTMQATRDLGAPGEMDENGMIRRVSVVPAPTKELDPVFISSNASVETISFAADNGFAVAYFSPTNRARDFGEKYCRMANDAGRPYALGQNQALVRWQQYGNTDAQLRAAVEAYDVDIYRDLYCGTTPMKFDSSNPVDAVLDSGVWVSGTTPGNIRDAWVSIWKQVPAEYVVLISHCAQEPAQKSIDNLGMFMEHVKPALDELTDYENAEAPAPQGVA